MSVYVQVEQVAQQEGDGELDYDPSSPQPNAPPIAPAPPFRPPGRPPPSPQPPFPPNPVAPEYDEGAVLRPMHLPNFGIAPDGSGFEPRPPEYRLCAPVNDQELDSFMDAFTPHELSELCQSEEGLDRLVAEHYAALPPLDMAEPLLALRRTLVGEG
jgi:hypothetical protein